MADNENSRILCLMKILTEETDREHILNASQLGEILENRYMIGSNRKTIYRDIDKLREFGLQIEQTRGNSYGYYLASRDFELPELKLLVDAVQSSKFITKNKSEELIEKLSRLTSRENAKALEREVYIYNRPKTNNETIYANVDVIYNAIRSNRQISFLYCEWNLKKQLVPRRGGEEYRASPLILTWDDENYYLVAYDSAAEKIKHYRVDKMKELRCSEEKREGTQLLKGFDLADFSKKTFGMFGGVDRKVQLECDNSMVGVILDRFGTDIMIIPAGSDHFRATVNVSVSPQFFGWLTGLGRGVKISWPEEVKEEYLAYMTAVLKGYQD